MCSCIFRQTIQIEEARAISLPTKFVKYGRKQIEPVLDSEFFAVTANTTEIARRYIVMHKP